jgi:hypothetical protein
MSLKCKIKSVFTENGEKLQQMVKTNCPLQAMAMVLEASAKIF